MSKSNPIPRRCLHYKAKANSVLFCGEFIHLSTIQMFTGISMSQLSRIFAGKRNPSISSAEKIAKALKMGMEEFLTGLRGSTAYCNYDTSIPPQYAAVPELKGRKGKKIRAYRALKEQEERAGLW